ncbi:C39 family peptidase [Bradyrhizobium sp. 61]|uniref:papain-like cysteine protease family protein n=1 Tax=unclassified Bradyrhizobium TaxID=2631580 RepID=UPI001FFA7715|nr:MULTISPECIES: papain-like cysteine protease family protein [unclassified Bradyrhizobium]MCK1275632.1 C39 family peptidase [Bradyrhizobium sp. 61]MCK1442869.1 C39 family peptidase [Bradyrhizobium sp. 48]MCK1460346.1 C39 family peptidase [Bradyrhizobium sp. 2]
MGVEEISVIERTRIQLAPDFTMQHQCHINWCWAAVASSISRYYDETSTFTQCRIADLELNRHDCCDFPCGTPGLEFDVTHTLGSPLNRVRCLALLAYDQRATRMEVQQEISAGRPICVRTVWSGDEDEEGPAHFVAIVGYLEDTDSLVIEDPLFGLTPEIQFNRFCSNYRDAKGVWTDTYFTKPPV